MTDSVYKFEMRDNVVHIMYNMIEDIDKPFLDANVIERKMIAHSYTNVLDWRKRIDNNEPVVEHIATSTYLAHIVMAAKLLKFPYPIYFIRVGRSMRNSDKDQPIYTWFNVSEIVEGHDNLVDVSDVISILF